MGVLRTNSESLPAAEPGGRVSQSTFYSRTRRRIGYWAILIGLIPGAAIMFIPFFWMYISSFKTPKEILQPSITWLPKTFYTAGYVETWQEATILQGYGNSLLIAGVTTILAVFTSAVCGYVFAKKEFAGKNLLFIFVLSTIMVPFFMLFIPSFVLYFKLGLKNTYLGLILPGVFTPFGILITRQFLHSVPNELLDAARADGAGDIRILWHIIIPLSRSVLSAIAILSFLGTFNDFLWPLVMIDDRHMFTLPLVLRLITGRQATREDQVLAAAVMSITPILIFFIIFQRHIIRGIALTGLKG
ncbi:MAG: carbohydrate ABC transporter permease [Chloroflexi bacterium]|nr:carbohydrate ABC transporter permease [Chloroflexota bacterium]